jgi:hypothetical protein
VRTRTHDVIQEIAAERVRQIDAEGYGCKGDDAYVYGELARAAAAYAVHFRHRQGRLWPWDCSQWKPGEHRRNCVKAAALLVAEIERIDRAEGGVMLVRKRRQPWKREQQ